MTSENSDLYKYVLDFSTCSSVEECNARLEAIPGFTTQPDYINGDLNILFSAGDGHNYKQGPLADKISEPNNPDIITNVANNGGYHIYSCLKTYAAPEILKENLSDLNKLNTEDKSYVRIMCFLDLTNKTQLKLFIEVFKLAPVEFKLVVNEFTAD